MRRYPFFLACWYLVNAVLVIAIGCFFYSAIWEFSTRSYLKGFSDAIIPASANREQKIDAILAWMEHGPARRSTTDVSSLSTRDPEQTLNYSQLLRVCGTASNAFVNLANSNDLPARRLLLLDEKRITQHVVVEVQVDNRWVIVDPSFRTLLRLPSGRLVTREELQDPAIFHAATESIPNYPSTLTYTTTAHVRLARVPLIGSYLRRIFNFIWPSWEESVNWTMLLERESFAMFVGSSLLLIFGFVSRFVLSWYSTHRLGVIRIRLRDQAVLVGDVLLSNSK